MSHLTLTDRVYSQIAGYASVVEKLTSLALTAGLGTGAWKIAEINDVASAINTWMKRGGAPKFDEIATVAGSLLNIHKSLSNIGRATRNTATNSGRGLSDLGGVIEQTGTNAAGGRIFTSTGTIAQKDFAGIVNSGLMRGEQVTILSGAHGAANGSIVADAAMFADDVARFGSMPGVRVLDVTKMSPAEIQAVMDGPGTIIGGFCNSGACLTSLGG